MEIHQDGVPLRVDEDGVIRVGPTRISFESVVIAFEQGADPESIIHMYRGLGLADAYRAVAYYLRHRQDVKEWLEVEEREAEELRRKLEAVQAPPRVSWETLLARKAEMEKRRVSAG